MLRKRNISNFVLQELGEKNSMSLLMVQKDLFTREN